MIDLGGIRFSFHPLFLFILISSVLTGYFLEILTLFCIVFVHEMGHVFAARGYGWQVREVRMLPFGGVAVVDGPSIAPSRQECVVALAGPLQNGLMAAGGMVLHGLDLWDTGWTVYFIHSNLMIGLFNLLPIMPLDGGRLLQACLSLRMPYHRAIWLTVCAGLIFSAFMVGFSLIPPLASGIQLNLLIVGIFLFYTNWVDYRHLPFRFIRFLICRTLPTRNASDGKPMPIFVRFDDTVDSAVKQLTRDRPHHIVVTGSAGTIRGIVSERTLIESFLRKNGANHTVGRLLC